MNAIKSDELLRIMEELPVSCGEEELILRGLAGADGAKPGILVLGGPTGDPMSLIPAGVSVFTENDAPHFPVEAVFGDKFYIRLYQGSLVREFARAEDFREASYEGAERCVIACPFEPLREVKLRFCYLDPDPDCGYTGEDFARFTEGLSACIFVLGAGDGALMNKMDDFCAWAAGRGMFAGSSALILNHSERDSVNPFLRTTLKKRLRGEPAAVLTATPFPEYADEDFEILPGEDALRLAVSAVSAADGAVSGDAAAERCRVSLIEKVRKEKQAVEAEEEQLRARIRICKEIGKSFPAYVRTMFPSADTVFPAEKKQAIHDELHRFLQSLYDSVPKGIEKCAEDSPDTYKNDLMCFAEDYLTDVLNGGIRALIGEVSESLTDALEQKLRKIRDDFSLYIQDAPEFTSLSGDRAEILNCANVNVSSLVPPLTDLVSKLPGIVAGAIANRFLDGSGRYVSSLVNSLFGDITREAAISVMPRGMFIGHVKKTLQDQLLDSMNHLDGMLKQYVYPMLEGYIMKSRDGMIGNYVHAVTAEEEALTQEADGRRKVCEQLEKGLLELGAD